MIREQSISNQQEHYKLFLLSRKSGNQQEQQLSMNTHKWYNSDNYKKQKWRNKNQTVQIERPQRQNKNSKVSYKKKESKRISKTILHWGKFFFSKNNYNANTRTKETLLFLRTKMHLYLLLYKWQ